MFLVIFVSLLPLFSLYFVHAVAGHKSITNHDLIHCQDDVLFFHRKDIKGLQQKKGDDAKTTAKFKNPTQVIYLAEGNVDVKLLEYDEGRKMHFFEIVVDHWMRRKEVVWERKAFTWLAA